MVKENNDQRKFPKRLYQSQYQENFDEEKFYYINVKRSQKQTYFYLSLAVFGVLLVCMFPIWPLELKLFMWWVSFILLILLTGILVVRLVVYAFCYSLGYDVWIFPDLLNDKVFLFVIQCGFFESFYKLISVNKRNDVWYQLVIRMVLFLSSAYAIYYLYQNPEVVEGILRVNFRRSC